MILFGVEDGSFDAFNRYASGYTILCGVLMQRDTILDVRLGLIEVDGFDATDELLKMMEGLEVDCVLLGGISFAGFNLIDPVRINDVIGIPVIVYSGKKPDNEEALRALQKHFPDWKERWKIIRSLGEIYSKHLKQNEPPVFFELIGCEEDWACDVLINSALISRIPEPLRVAGLMAKGLSQIFENL